MTTLLGAIAGALLAIAIGTAPAAAAEPAYCNGQRINDASGVLYYPNGQRFTDSQGKQFYPNGTRITNDYGDEIRYSNGARVRNASKELLFPTGTPVKSATGDVRYPSGARTRDAFGKCYYETGAEMNPCQQTVPIRQRLPGGETIFYRLDTSGGTIDLTEVLYEFPSESLRSSGPRYVLSLAANLATGQIDRASIAVVCTSVAR